MGNYRKTALAAACVILSSVLSGCGDTGTKNYDKLLDNDSPVAITIWHYYNGIQQTQFDDMVAEFNNTVGMEKGIIVEAFSKNSVNELADSVVASLNNDAGADALPNIFGTYAETAYIADKKGALADISRFFTDEELDEYVDEYIAEGRINSGSGDQTLKIFPVAKSTEIMMINVTDWAKFAEAENVFFDDLSTWEGLAATAEKYYNYTDGLTPDIPNDGKAFFGRDSIANYMVTGAKQLGCAFAEPDGDGNVVVSADKEVLRRLWENYYVPFVKGYYAADSRFRSDDMKTGNIIAMVCSNSAASYCPNEVTINDDHTYPIDIAVLQVPNFEGCDPYIVQQGAGMSVVKSDDKTEYACAVFLKWFTEEERNIEFAVNSGYLPVKKSANDINKIISYKSDISDNLKGTFEVAIGEINSYNLYTSVPYEASADVRSYIDSTLTNTAKDAYEEASSRIDAGEDRTAVLGEYTNDAAFEKWYSDFAAGLDNVKNPGFAIS